MNVDLCLEVDWHFFREKQLFCFYSQQGSTLEEKNLPFWGKFHCLRKRGDTKVASFCENGKSLCRCIHFILICLYEKEQLSAQLLHLECSM